MPEPTFRSKLTDAFVNRFSSVPALSRESFIDEACKIADEYRGVKSFSDKSDGNWQPSNEWLNRQEE